MKVATKAFLAATLLSAAVLIGASGSSFASSDRWRMSYAARQIPCSHPAEIPHHSFALKSQADVFATYKRGISEQRINNFNVVAQLYNCVEWTNTVTSATNSKTIEVFATPAQIRDDQEFVASYLKSTQMFAKIKVFKLK